MATQRRAWTLFASVFAIVGLAACTSSSPAADSGPTPPARQESDAAPAAAVGASGAVQTPSGFAPLNRATGFGLLRVMSLEERPNARDVVIYQALPNEMPRVAGIITTVGQTPLAHVNLRAVQDKIPNAVVPNATTDPAITALIGRYVRYEVTAAGFMIAAATIAEVDQHHGAARPRAPQVPQRDLSVREITPLSEIEFEDWRAFGVKAANLATLRRFDLPDGVQVPDGVAVPFRYYDDFMKVNGFYQRARSILEDDRFQSDPEWQDEQLAEFRRMIRAAPMSNAVLEELQDAQNRFPQGRALRCRSSTNNEDLPGFSGAGLYDSFTQRVDEGHLVKCVKQVYASTWNLRAVLEREFSRIDQMQTAMGVLIHPNFEGEQANGVAVATDPIYGNTDAIYINTQLGEDLVTNPEDRSVPESLLLFDDGELSVLTRSSRVKPGARLLTDEQVTALRDTLAVINRDFAALYERGESERFAMEIEFKITRQGALAVKQARPWVFSDPV
jgi:hypothetical protein